MRRKFVNYLALASLLLPLGGCGSASPPSPPRDARPAAVSGFPLTVTDDRGAQITLEAPPQRIVSLAPAHTETLYALGAGARLVAADTYSDYPPEARAKATLRPWPRAPLEQLVALRPDLVLVLTPEVEEIRQMEAAGLTVLKLFPQTLEKAWDELVLLGRITGTEDRARGMVEDFRAQVKALQERLEGVTPPRVLLELDASDPSRPFVAGSGGFYGQLLNLAGGRNIFHDIDGPSGQVSAEQVIARDPEVILLGDAQSPFQPQTPALVGQRRGWKGIAAVRSRRIYPVDSNRITRPGPRLVEGLEEIARHLHPERFE